MARTTLTTVEEIKARLSIPSTVTNRDALIDGYREAVEEDILALTGFTFLAGSKVDSFHTDWQRGTTRLSRFRPILALTNIEGRAHGTQATFNQLHGDVKDPFQGRVLLVGYQNAFYDPRSGDYSYGGDATWFKWREYTWPIVRLTYTVDPLGSETNPIPKALTTATVESVAALLNRPAGAGAITSVSIEGISESYGQGAKPGQLIAPAALALLARYIRGSVTMQH